MYLTQGAVSLRLHSERHATLINYKIKTVLNTFFFVFLIRDPGKEHGQFTVMI